MLRRVWQVSEAALLVRVEESDEAFDKLAARGTCEELCLSQRT